MHWDFPSQWLCELPQGFLQHLPDCWAGAALSFICSEPLKRIRPALTSLGSLTPKQRQQQGRFLDRFKLQNTFNIYYEHQKHLSTVRWRQKELVVVHRWKVRFWRCLCWIWVSDITNGPLPSVRVVLPLPFGPSNEWRFKERKWVET